MIPDIINASGVQILIFLAGLQSIPGSLYEASEWKVPQPGRDFG